MTPTWAARGHVFADHRRPEIMAILNVTPDSFSDSDASRDVGKAIDLAQKFIDDGAGIIDVGGESSRPGAAAVDLDEELRRVIPVVTALAKKTRTPISVDTVKPEVARRALDSGAAIINDITGLSQPAMVEVVARHRAGVVIMHMAGTPQTMQVNPQYRDVVAEVHVALGGKIDRAVQAGIVPEAMAIDPGIGFGKTFEHNLELLNHLDRFLALGPILLVGTSRKRFLGDLTGRDVTERMVPSVASALAAAARGARVVRVHDVAETHAALLVWQAQNGWPALSV